ncbi:MAG: EAL domain-containing protein [Proteobacteria bacterium]|jgi:diguanylate cyclase (GGDEF)-like protein|nr:EAL domain-containing protein [Pseudomonadota bacterium]
MFRLNSFRARVISWGALMGVTVLILMLSINLHSIEEQINHQIEARINYTRDAYQAALAMPLAERDDVTLHEMIDIWGKSGDISYLVVMDETGNRRVSVGLADDEPLPAPGKADSVYHVRFDVVSAGKRYGSLQYGLLTDYLTATRERLILYNIITALVGICLSCILLVIFSRHVVKPLINLSNAAELITSGNYDVQLETTGVSELDSLLKHFRAMALTVSSKISMLEWQAQHDALTDAFNRRAFEKRASELLDDPEISDVIMLYIDLDQFKAINDSCGHNAGDILLTRVAHLLESRLSEAFVARIGGDEFGAVMPLNDEMNIQKIAQTIIEDISNISFEWEGQSYRVGASIGVASSSSLGIRSLKELMIAADTACFGAKELGRSRIQVYHPNDDYFRQRREDLRSVAQLDNMLAQNRFALHYQRFSPLAGDRRSHAEILLRVRNPEGGFDIPVSLIHAAERYNLMPRIDHWVIKSACQQIAQWEKEKREIGIECFSINVSGASLSDERFPDFVLDQIHANSVSPKKLCFEITESSAIANLNTALHFIESVRRAGATVALDDFGSDLSSFGYLKRFQADYLKIDGAFISNIDTDSANFATVKAIVTLARAHGLRTVAEFVHNNSILRVIREIGVDYAQGFHCHMPEPLNTLPGRYTSASRTECIAL